MPFAKSRWHFCIKKGKVRIIIKKNSGFACESEPCTDEPNWLRELAHKQTYSSEAVYGECRDNEQRKLRVVGMVHMC